MKSVYSVGQVNSYIKNMFAQDYMLRSIDVSGEVSNVKYHSSGHVYFTMKDKDGAIACVMFAANAKRLQFRLSEGTLVIASGSVNVYERDGKYQLYVNSVRTLGAGELYEKYEELKRNLEEMGMFDSMYKKPIPKYVRRVGVVTASTGAAIQDITQISKRRNPYVQLILYPAQVQGIGAKESIVRGINTLDLMGLDVIIVGRGGGSIEDLWAFNEECVANAIFNCNTPIISAVGHETDTTIADYVADLRAPTPSAAAELAVYSYEDVEKKIDNLASGLNYALRSKIGEARDKTAVKRATLESMSPKAVINAKRLTYVNLYRDLELSMQTKLDAKRHKFELMISQMKMMSPLNRLSNGFAQVTDAKGRVIGDINNICEGDSIRLAMKGGFVSAGVTNVELIEQHE